MGNTSDIAARNDLRVYKYICQSLNTNISRDPGKNWSMLCVSVSNIFQYLALSEVNIYTPTYYFYIAKWYRQNRHSSQLIKQFQTSQAKNSSATSLLYVKNVVESIPILYSFGAFDCCWGKKQHFRSSRIICRLVKRRLVATDQP